MTPVFSFAEFVAKQPAFERAIAAIAPEYANRRLLAKWARYSFAYDGARADRSYAPRTTGEPAEGYRSARDRITMMWEALDLVENFPPAKAVLGKFSTFLTPTEWAPATGDRDYDALVSEYFHDWCKRADVTGRHSFRKLVQIAAESRPSYGDCGFALRRVDDELRLQLVPGDRIGNPNEVTTDSPTAPRYFSGVVVGEYGQPVAYRIYRVTTGGSYVDPEDIPASSFCHYFDPFRADQYRGVTDFHAVLRTARMLKEILDAEMVGVRYASAQAALVFNERGQAPTRNLFTPQAAATMANGEMPKHEETSFGIIKYLRNGDKVEVMPARPSSAFAGFVEELKREIALGLGGYPAGVLWGTSDYRGPSVRAEFAQADRVNARHQGILTDKVLEPIKNAVIIDAIAHRRIPPPNTRDGEDVSSAVVRATRGTWRFPPRLTIDAGNESAADLGENRQGAKSLSQIAAERGRDAYQTLVEIADEAAFIKMLAAERGIPETAIRLPVQQLPQTVAGAAIVGEGAGAAAAAAQQASVQRPAGGGASGGDSAGGDGGGDSAGGGVGSDGEDTTAGESEGDDGEEVGEAMSAIIERAAEGKAQPLLDVRELARRRAHVRRAMRVRAATDEEIDAAFARLGVAPVVRSGSDTLRGEDTA